MSRPRVGVLALPVAVYENFLKFIDSGGVCASCIPSLTMNEEKGGTIMGSDTAAGTSANIILEEISRQLEIFAVDIVLVAPVHAKLFQSFKLTSIMEGSRGTNGTSICRHKCKKCFCTIIKTWNQ